jgi:hypothetical protein
MDLALTPRLGGVKVPVVTVSANVITVSGIEKVLFKFEHASAGSGAARSATIARRMAPNRAASHA